MAQGEPKPARDVAPGERWCFVAHRSMAEVLSERPTWGQTVPTADEFAMAESPEGKTLPGDRRCACAGLTNAVCARLTGAFALDAQVLPDQEAWAAAFRYVSRGKSLATMVPLPSCGAEFSPAVLRPAAGGDCAGRRLHSNALPWPREAIPGGAGRSVSSSRPTAPTNTEMAAPSVHHSEPKRIAVRLAAARIGHAGGAVSHRSHHHS